MLQHGMVNKNWPIGHILKHILKSVKYFLNKHEKPTSNPLIQTFINIIENRMLFKIKG